MGHLTGTQARLPSRDNTGPAAVFVNGVRYTNSAAKFWPRLVDEVLEDFPGATSIALTSYAGGALEHEVLYPEIAFERDLNRLLFTNLAEAMQRVMAELELMGTPGSVALRVMEKEQEILLRELPLDCVDAEIFPYLVAWPLEWAGIPESRWNDACLAGRLMIEDRARKRAYDLDFELTGKHLSEGLYEKSIAVRFSRRALP